MRDHFDAAHVALVEDVLVEQALAGIEDGAARGERHDLVLAYDGIEIFGAELSERLVQPVVGEAAFQRLLMAGRIGHDGRLQFVGGDQLALQMIHTRGLERRIFINMNTNDAGIQSKTVEARNGTGVDMCQSRLRFRQLLQNFFLFQAIHQHHFRNARCKSSPVGGVQSRTPAASFVSCRGH